MVTAAGAGQDASAEAFAGDEDATRTEEVETEATDTSMLDVSGAENFPAPPRLVPSRAPAGALLPSPPAVAPPPPPPAFGRAVVALGTSTTGSYIFTFPK